MSYTESVCRLRRYAFSLVKIMVAFDVNKFTTLKVPPPPTCAATL